jgi:hypothetical protein
MEYLQGRALTNAIGNLGITDGYAQALKSFGHELEDIVEQVTCFLQIKKNIFFFFELHICFYFWNQSKVTRCPLVL